jgi:hypothetical protein
MPKYQLKYNRVIAEEAIVVIQAKTDTDVEEALCEIDNLDNLLKWYTCDYAPAEQCGDAKIVNNRTPVTEKIQKKVDKILKKWDELEAKQ